MDRADTIGKYVLPNGTTVVRAFTLKNFIFYTADNERLTGQQALDRHDDIVRFATEYDIQKNRVNGQLIMFAREDRFPDFCPVRLALSIVRLATDLGASAPEDPLCLYRTDLGDVQYFRYATKLEFPRATAADLRPISTHSIRVTACVLLHEAGMDATYIKLRLRWKSNCFEVNLRNTPRITTQHNDALAFDNHELLRAITDISTNLLPPPSIVTIDESFPDDIPDDD